MLMIKVNLKIYAIMSLSKSDINFDKNFRIF